MRLIIITILAVALSSGVLAQEVPAPRMLGLLSVAQAETIYTVARKFSLETYQLACDSWLRDQNTQLVNDPESVDYDPAEPVATVIQSACVPIRDDVLAHDWQVADTTGPIAIGFIAVISTERIVVRNKTFGDLEKTPSACSIWLTSQYFSLVNDPESPNYDETKPTTEKLYVGCRILSEGIARAYR